MCVPTYTDQIVRDCALRGLPEPSVIEPLPDRQPRALDFHRFRSKRGLKQPDRQAQRGPSCRYSLEIGC